MEFDTQNAFRFFSTYWGFAIATAFYGVARWYGDKHLPQSAKESLTLWLRGEYESTWSHHFRNLFDAVFGSNHLSWQCFFRSAIASIIAVTLLYVLLTEVLGVMKWGSRINDGTTNIGGILLWAAFLNIVPDYISLLETRLMLKLLGRAKTFGGQLGLLVTDATITGAISWISINFFFRLINIGPISVVEMLALFSWPSLFFYSTFLTSVWSWLYCLSTWFMKLFVRTPLRRILETDKNPDAQIALVGAVLIFVIALVLMPAFSTNEHRISVFDQMLCVFFPGDICHHIARLDEEKEVLAYVEKSCFGGNNDQCARMAYMIQDTDPWKAFMFFRSACEDGVMNACSGLGSMYQEGRGVVRDDTKAVELFQQACEGGDTDGCARLGYMHHMRRGGLVQNKAEVVVRLEQACERRDMVACANLGAMYQGGLGGLVQDDTKAVELYQQACEHGRVPGLLACTFLGAMYQDGRGGLVQDDTKAVELYRQACEGHDLAELNACAYLGAMYQDGRGGLVQDDTKAVELYQQACEHGRLPSLLGCTFLGSMYQEGRGGLVQDDTKAVELYQQACKSGVPHGCIRLGVMYHGGRGGLVQNENKAVELYQRACEGRDMGGCAWLGAMYQEGRGGLVQDNTKAVQLYRQACEGRAMVGCAYLGAMYQDGHGGLVQNENKAVELYRQACEGGDSFGCSLLAITYDKKGDFDHAEPYYQRAIKISPEDAVSLGNLSRILFVQGDKTDAELILIRAEAAMANGETFEVLALELAFYRYAHIQGTLDALMRIRNLLSKNVRSPGWDLSPNVRKAMKDGHPEPKLLDAIALVISDQENIATLSQFELWRRVTKNNSNEL